MNRSDKAAARNKAVSWIHQMGPEFYNALGPSGGTDNNTLVDYLVRQGIIYTPLLEQVFRAVDRGNYCPDHRGFAYKDVPWAIESLDLFAPSVYSKIMEYLEVKPGLSFLNLGSGSGYLNTMAGLILGPYGINHGIELYNDNVKFANERLHDFIENARAIDEYDFCVPSFFEGNCFLLDDTCQKYDRVFCGARCPEKYEGYVKNLVKVGGILVMPRNEKMQKITRIEESTWSTCSTWSPTSSLQSISVTSLITPPSLTQDESPEYVKISNFCLPKLQHLCRSNIRAILKKNIDKDYHNFKNNIDKDYPNLKKNIDKDYPNLKNKTLLEMKHSQRSRNITISSSIESDQLLSLYNMRFLRYSASELKSTLEFLKKKYNNDDSLDTLMFLSKRASDARKHIPRNSDSEMEEDSKNDNIAEDSVKKDFENSRNSDSEMEEDSKNDNIAEDSVKKDSENGDSYTEHMIKRIASLPLPSSLIKYINYDRNNL